MISLNYRDSRPIYEQIRDGLRKLIVTGALSADEKLPSVRALAAQLAINPNTIQRAYNELEGEGYIYSVPGKGSFAAANAAAGSAPGGGAVGPVGGVPSPVPLFGGGRRGRGGCPPSRHSVSYPTPFYRFFSFQAISL